MQKKIKLACILLFAFSNLYAFDGVRKGFILGGGIGAGYLSNTNSFNSFSVTDSRVVFLTNFKIGYVPSNSLELYYTSKVSWWSQSKDITGSSTIFTTGLSAIAATLYIDNTIKTGWFVSGGFGLSILDEPFESYSASSNGFGFFGGGGYEFSGHWSVELDLLYSTITDAGNEFNSFGVLMTVNFLAF